MEQRRLIVEGTRYDDLVTGEVLARGKALNHDPVKHATVVCVDCGQETSAPRKAIPVDAPTDTLGRVQAQCPRCYAKRKI